MYNLTLKKNQMIENPWVFIVTLIVIGLLLLLISMFV